jgi:hypothetical protein
MEQWDVRVVGFDCIKSFDGYGMLQQASKRLVRMWLRFGT